MVVGKARLQAGEWTDFLKKIKTNIAKSSDMLKLAFATFGFKDIMNHFKQEQSPTGRWKAIKRKGKILQDKGILRGSILPRNTKRFSKDSIIIFAGAKYGGKHDRGEGGMTKREFMWFSGNAEEKMAKLILSLVIK